MVPREHPSTYRFADFELDVRACRLTRGGQPVKLEPKAFDVLLCLLRRGGDIASRRDLVAEAWGGIAITDNAVARVIAHLRRALDDHPDRPRFVETIPTRGYRFIGQIEVEADAPGTPSWASERGTAGPGADFSQGSAPSRKGAPKRSFLLAAVALATAAIALVAWTFGFRTQDRGSQAQPRSVAFSAIRTLAVLPLRNLTGDASQDYIADGVTQGLSDRFSELGLFGVIATTSSAHFRNTDLPATRVAKELGADALIEGTVIRSGDRVRVSVSLVDGGSGQRVWSGRSERPFGDVMALYDEVAATVAGEAKLAVDAVNATRRSGRSVDPEAYDAYLRAMNALGNRWMAGGCREAEPRLLDVVERDRSFAPALAALAWCYAYPDRLGRDASEVVPKAKAAVSRALALDDRLALAHVVDGTIKWRMEYDVAAGEAALGRALERDPSSGLVLMPSAEILLWRGQIERGLALLDRAARLDPLSPDRNLQVGFSLLMIGRYAAAIERFEHALVLDPQSLTARYWLAEAMGYVGRHDRAVAEYLSWLDGALHPGQARAVRRRLEDAYARGGWSAFWREELAVALEEVAQPGAFWAPRGQERYTGPYHIARRQARLGRQEEALDALERAYESRSHLIAVAGLDPLFEPLRPTARFQALLEKTGARPAGPSGP